MAFKTPTYPTILTKTDWDNQKGTLAKLHGETGLGDSMQKAKAAFDAVNWRAIVACSDLQPSASVAELDKLWERADAEHPRVTALDKALRDLEALAGRTYTKFKESKTVPSGKADHVGRVRDEAKKLNLATAWVTVVAALKPGYDTARAAAERREREQRLRVPLEKSLEMLKRVDKAVRMLDRVADDLLKRAAAGQLSAQEHRQSADGLARQFKSVQKERQDGKNDWFTLRADVDKQNDPQVKALFADCERLDAALRENGNGLEKTVSEKIARLLDASAQTAPKAPSQTAKPEWATFMGLPWPTTYEDADKAYKKLRVQFHPDRNYGKEKEAEEQFKKLYDLYEEAKRYFGK